MMRAVQKQSARVCVVTPVYNTEHYLAECIESVLAQTHTNFEYLIADNASTDGSLAIAESYAAKDNRIRVLAFKEHLDQLPNYNRALREIHGEFDYCKVVQADDAIFSTCLEEMIALADTDSDITIVGAYTILQNRVFLDGLDYSESVLDGKELCRRYLFDGPYILGSPTTCLYRMDQVTDCNEFYPENSVFGDTDAAFRIALQGKFGFVHQVLSFARMRNEGLSEDRKDFEIDALTRRLMFEKYGSTLLSGEEGKAVGSRLRWRHRRVLGKAALRFEGPDFWAFHKLALRQVGADFGVLDVLPGAMIEFFRGFVNIESVFRRSKS